MYRVCDGSRNGKSTLENLGLDIWSCPVAFVVDALDREGDVEVDRVQAIILEELFGPRWVWEEHPSLVDMGIRFNALSILPSELVSAVTCSILDNQGEICGGRDKIRNLSTNGVTNGVSFGRDARNMQLLCVRASEGFAVLPSFK